MDKEQNTQHAEQSDDSVFGHLLNNSQETDRLFYTGERFKVGVKVNDKQFMRNVLVDIGSTISSITKVIAEELKLELVSTPGMIISNANNSQHYTTKKAIMNSTFKEKEESKYQNDYRQDTRTVPNLTSETTTQSKITAPYQHSINTGDTKPIATRDFRRSAADNAAIAEEIKVMLQKGVIVSSQSDWCSLVILIKKPDGTVRLCVDYRNLSKVVIKDELPLP